MKDIEPVLDMVKAFGAPYTGLAVGTLTGLFVVRQLRPADRSSDLKMLRWLC